MFFVVSLFALPLYANAQYVQGEDYRRIDVNLPRDAQTIEVVEFFSYACPYCARVETPLQVWNEMKPENVTFTRVAIPRKGRWITYAKAFYALQAIDPALEQKLAPEIMKAVVYHKQNLDDNAIFVKWIETLGVDREEFAGLLASNAIAQKVEEAMILSEQYGVPSVPAIYVDGRYHLIDNNTYYEKIPLMLNALIAQAWEERKQSGTQAMPQQAAPTQPIIQEVPQEGDDMLACKMDADANSCQ